MRVVDLPDIRHAYAAPVGDTGDACERCGHDTHVAPSAGERLRRATGRQPRRVECGHPTELGPCPCLSRFHVR